MHENAHTPEPVEIPDAWHRHTADEGAPQHEHGARANPIAVGMTLLGIVFAFLFLVLVTWAYFNSYKTRLVADRSESLTDELRTEYLTARADAMTRLSSPASWVDQSAGTVRLPLARARELVLADYRTLRAGSPASEPSLAANTHEEAPAP